jgi:hypothetical protein
MRMRTLIVFVATVTACGRGGFERVDDIVFRAGDEGSAEDPSPSCLDAAASVEVITGHHEDRVEPTLAADRAFDAREATFRIVDVQWGIIDLVGTSTETNICWVGGDVDSNKPWSASWDEHTDLSGPTRNNAAITVRSYDTTVSGMCVFNVLDAFRTSSGYDWTVQHSWAQYIRSDCVENDGLHSGRIYDVLFDGCYSGISVSDTSATGAGEVVTLDRVLLRLQPMPYPYDWETRSGVIDENGDPYAGTGIPYGADYLFKYLTGDLARSPHFVIKNSIFLGTHFTRARAYDFPDDSLIDECSNNTVIWLDDGTWPGQLPSSSTFPDCVTVLTGAEGETFWKNAVADWHARHPSVGAARKPTDPGALVFPRVF